MSRATIKNRNTQIDQADGNLDFRQLQDIKQDMAIQGRQEGLSKMRGSFIFNNTKCKLKN